MLKVQDVIKSTEENMKRK